MKRNLYKFNLFHLFRQEVARVHPSALVSRANEEEAILCWGKAAQATWQALGAPIDLPHLLIGPEQGEHPFPGLRSFQSGARLLEFLAYLGRIRVRRLRVHLSGGASSLAWVRPDHLSERQLRRRLESLYRAPSDIRRINQERTKLCALKGGGAARWLAKFAPNLTVRVEVISDVEPHGVDVVGSGPFWDGRIPHRLLAGNSTLVSCLRRHTPILEARSSISAVSSEWIDLIRPHVLRRKPGLIILGGEPKIPLRGKGRGGRMSHLAAQIALEFPGIEALCATTDGVDGTSESSATWLRAGLHLDPRKLHQAIRTFNTAPLLKEAGALIPAGWTGTNVQDVVLVKVT